MFTRHDSLKAGYDVVIIGAGIGVVVTVGLLTLVFPRILVLDVDGGARPVMGDRLYAEGLVTVAVPELP